MARFNKIAVLEAVVRTAMVPVYYHSDTAVMEQVIKACYDGGVRAFEFANRGDFAHEEFGTLQKWVTVHCPEMIMGVGTVIDAPTAALYIQEGANFVVSPLMHDDIANLCNRRLIPYMPGCGSVTEIGHAQEMGCDICKVFPAGNVGGPSFVKNILAPLPWSMIMATGAVAPTRENLTEWMESGVSCVGMGSKLFPKDVVAAGDWAWITNKAAEALAILQEAKQNK